MPLVLHGRWNLRRCLRLLSFNPGNPVTCLLARLHLRLAWHLQMLWRRLRRHRDSYLAPGDLRIVYESDSYLVVNKAFDLSVNTSSRWLNPLALNTQLFLARHWLADASAYHWFRFCHQIDHATSGLLLLAYSAKAASKASRAFQQRRVLKQYLAIVWGHLASPEPLTVDAAIGHDRVLLDERGPPQTLRFTEAYYRCLDPKPALSQLVPLELGHFCGRPATKVLLLLKHGRTHQLRVHTSSVGHPIVGDLKYSRRQLDFLCRRMMLHAYRLRLRLPDGETVDCVADDPFTEAEEPQWRSDEVVNDYRQFRDCALLPSAAAAAAAAAAPSASEGEA